MTQKPSQSRRARRVQHQSQQKRRRSLTIALTIAGVVIIAGLMFWTRQITTTIAARGIVVPEVADEPANADGRAWGPEDAVVVIEEFSDFQCPYCGQFALGAGEQIRQMYGDTGQVRFVYNHYAFLGPESVRAAEATECANEQGAFWRYHDMLFLNQKGENQSAFNDRSLKTFAVNLGLDTAVFNACLDSGKYSDLVQADREIAQSRNVSSTPTFFINGEEVRGALPFAQFQSMIDAILAGSS